MNDNSCYCYDQKQWRCDTHKNDSCQKCQHVSKERLNCGIDGIDLCIIAIS
jgi:hypothetical protein